MAYPINSNTLSAKGDIVVIPYGEDPLHRLAELLFDHPGHHPADLSRRVVLLANPGAAGRFRQHLLHVATQQGHSALLPPTVTTLKTWLQGFTQPDSTILSNTARELLLFDALADHPSLQERLGVWPLLDGLLGFFDELNTHQRDLPAQLEDLTQSLATGYGIADRHFGPLSTEARWIHSTWRAWRQRLAELNGRDESQARAENLHMALASLQTDQHVYLAGYPQFTRTEIAWIKQLQKRTQVTLLLQGQPGPLGYHPDSLLSGLLSSLEVNLESLPPVYNKTPYTRFLNRVYALDDGDEGKNILPVRAAAQQADSPQSPARDTLKLCMTADAEQEARAIDLQVRLWWLSGLRHIGIVTNDRKLARRVRALLERANIFVRDTAGWPLSTTSAASALSRWLETVESQFSHAPMLDWLKSPFALAHIKTPALEQSIAQFEQGVLRYENLAAGLKRYREAVVRARQRLDETYAAGSTDRILELLEQLERARVPLLPLLDAKHRPVSEYLNALNSSLDLLGMRTSYAQDEAGQRLLEELAGMQAAASQSGTRFNWAEFRTWLARKMERSHFRPPLLGRDVELMGLAESRLYHYDALIIAGTQRDQLPGPGDISPFFNDNVRAQLGLPGRQQQRYERFHDFRRLLEAAPKILITWRQEQNGEPVMPSPWVERVRAFHALAYGNNLTDPQFSHWLASNDTLIAQHEPESVLPPRQDYPRAHVPAARIPSVWSASSHQRLLDCPYQFYASDCLGLREAQDIRTDLEKVDYGQRIHRILQAFHSPVAGLPGPFKARLNETNRVQAETLLKTLSEVVFAQDMAKDFSARGWLYRWLNAVPAYLTWQQQRASTWQPHATEITCTKTPFADSQLTLTGRLDRLDQSNAGYAIIDYKTGRLPELEEVLRGEQIQLPFYALLLDVPVQEALFLAIETESVKDKVKLTDTGLETLTRQVAERLKTLQQALEQETPLPAWGDPQTCARCPMEGLCRKEMWQASPSP